MVEQLPTLAHRMIWMCSSELCSSKLCSSKRKQVRA